EETLGCIEKENVLKSKLQRVHLAAARFAKYGANTRANETAWNVEDLRHLDTAAQFHLLPDWSRFLAFSGWAGMARTAGFFSCGTFFPRLSLSAATRSMTWARGAGAAAMVISLPCALLLISSRTRSRYSSSYFCGLNCSLESSSISLSARLVSASVTL